MSGLITNYMASGLAASRPATPSITAGALSYYYATDTNTLSVFDGSTWHTVSAGGGGAITAPTIVQQATGHAATSTSASFTVTFSANTTVDNVVAFLVTGFWATVTIGSQSPYSLVYSGMPLANEMMTLFVMPVQTAATTYTVNIASPNGGTNCLALELSGLADWELKPVAPRQPSTTQIKVPLFGKPGALNILMIQSDNNHGAISGGAPSGLTTLYDSGPAGVNHSGMYFQINSGVGSVATINSTSTMSGVISGTAIFTGG